MAKRNGIDEGFGSLTENATVAARELLEKYVNIIILRFFYDYQITIEKFFLGHSIEIQ